MVEDTNAKEYTTVDIDIINVNDEAPVFTDPNSEININENLAAGSSVFTFQVSWIVHNNSM